MTTLRQSNPSTSVKLYRCAICKTGYRKWSSTQQVCGKAECAIALVERKKAKKARAERKEDKARLLELKPLGYWADALQEWVNRYVRLRDAGQPCISCGTLTAEAWHAGHFLSRGARPELRFHLDNIHRQCMQCNYFGAGNQAVYRTNLVEKIGLDRVEWLEGPHPMPKHPRSWYQAQIVEFKAKCKEMKQ